MADNETTKTVKLKNKGGFYRGYDEGLNKTVVVGKGETVEVSETKADQLRADFPEDWVAARAASTKSK